MMINILISVRADLVSSIALRYAGQLGEIVEIGLQPIHVKEPEERGNLFGTGWVRHTWEHALAEKGEEEINQLIRTEKRYCPALAAPRVLVGEREREILRELQSGGYDLFMEGVLASFNEGDFKKLVQSRLYRSAPCPIIMVKNLVALDKVAFIVGEGGDAMSLVERYTEVLGEADLLLDLLYYSPDRRSPELIVQDAEGQIPQIDKTIKALEGKGQRTGKVLIITGPSREVAEHLSDYGLVACAIQDEIRRKSKISSVLARTPSPLFLC